MDQRERIARALAAHKSWKFGYCECGWEAPLGLTTAATKDAVIGHQADAVVAVLGQDEYEPLGIVRDAGGGHVDVWVHRELERYPAGGAEVFVRRTGEGTPPTEPPARGSAAENTWTYRPVPVQEKKP